MKLIVTILFWTVVPIQLFAGITQQQFNTALNEIRDTYSAELRANGLRLVIESLWSNNDLLAHIKIPRGKAILTISGGYARQKQMTADAFRIVLCHEIGHILGGAPKQSNGHWSSMEGQADYFATAKCIKKIIPINQNQKQRVLDAALVLGKLTATQNGEDPSLISLDKKDLKEIPQTTSLHPNPQCRLDTMVAGYLCPISENDDFSNTDPNTGACLHQSVDADIRSGARPRCWYRPPTTHLRCTSEMKLPFHNSTMPVMTVILDKWREDNSIQVQSMVSVALPVNNHRERSQSDSQLQTITGEQSLLQKIGNNKYQFAISPVLFDQLKEKSLLHVDWNKLKVKVDSSKRILFHMNCVKR